MTDIPQEWVEAALEAGIHNSDAWADDKPSENGKVTIDGEFDLQAALAAVIPLVRADAKRERDRYREALEEIARRTNLLIHQNTGRWDMTIEHDQRSYNVSEGNLSIAHQALKGDT